MSKRMQSNVIRINLLSLIWQHLRGRQRAIGVIFIQAFVMTVF